MAQSNSRERLNRLLELAARGAAGRTALLDELVSLLTDWPHDYAQAMRAPFEALFEKTAREAEKEVRARLAARLADHEELPVALLNAFFLDAPGELRVHILKRNAALDDAEPPLPADGAALVAAARKTMNGAFAETFAKALALPRDVAEDILKDADATAVVCKGARLDRAAYSAIALLACGGKLAVYDDIPQAAAERLTRFWQERR